jgi:hypothetical protein
MANSTAAGNGGGKGFLQPPERDESAEGLKLGATLDAAAPDNRLKSACRSAGAFVAMPSWAGPWQQAVTRAAKLQHVRRKDTVLLYVYVLHMRPWGHAEKTTDGGMDRVGNMAGMVEEKAQLSRSEVPSKRRRPNRRRDEARQGSTDPKGQATVS